MKLRRKKWNEKLKPPNRDFLISFSSFCCSSKTVCNSAILESLLCDWVESQDLVRQNKMQKKNRKNLLDQFRHRDLSGLQAIRSFDLCLGAIQKETQQKPMNGDSWKEQEIFVRARVHTSS